MDVDGGGGGCGDGVGGEVRVGGGVDRHSCLTAGERRIGGVVVLERWVWRGGWDGVWIARLGVRAVCNLLTQMSEIDWGTRS